MYGPSTPTATVNEGGVDVPLYDLTAIALQFGWTRKNAFAHAGRGHFGTPRIIDGDSYYEKRIVDQFLPDNRGPKRRIPLVLPSIP
jgi:hypothetical protein